MEHALGRSFNISLKWSKHDKVPEEVRKKVELDVFDLLESTFLSGVLDVGEAPVLFPQIPLYHSPFAPSISYFLNFKLPIERRP